MEIYEYETAQKRSKPFATYAFIGINILMWLVTAYYGFRNNLGSSDVNLIFGAKYNPLIMEGQYWRLVTPIFLHGGIVHLLVNSYSLYAVGPEVESIFGVKRYIFLYLASGVLGNIASFIFSPSVSVGASGAIFGLMGTLLYIGLRFRKTFSSAYYINIVGIILFNILYGLSQKNIDNYAHIGGLAGGLICSVLTGLEGERLVTGRKVLGWILAAAVFAGGIFAGNVAPKNVGYKLVEQAEKSFDEKQYEKSGEFAAEALKLNVQDRNITVRATYILSASLINQGKFDQALEYSKDMVNLYPKVGHYLLGLNYKGLGENDAAREELEKSLELDPENKQVKEILDSLSQ
ncbi:MAG: rhomboid family intramembrane serine protease [Clostridiales bacterium]|jgi:rhomboid protease GluP|nr:rhomboid family intramembrane serine protease [Eubacteriales bacterium]MDH7566670.1 rhomboid family intramembrane serine protease [Clostridiales bacterium]